VRLFDPAWHQGLAARDWEEGAVREWIARVADDAHRRFDVERWWPPHPLDLDGDSGSEPCTPLYHGAGGVIWGLDELARRGYAPRVRDYGALLEPLIALNLRQVEAHSWGTESFMIGQSGLLLLAYRLAPGAAIAERVATSIARNVAHPSNELLWGVPGTMHVALAMHEWTGDVRWADAYRSDAPALARAFAFDDEAQCHLWTQDLYGDRVRYLGAAHGFAGNAQAVLRGAHLLDAEQRAWWRERIVTTTLRTAVRDGDHANWSALWPPSSRTPWRVQWCHGAAGMIAALAGLDDPRLDEVLVAAGELVWDAGPLDKGGGLCHGTAGNGYAFLKLHERTTDARWMERARAFAMHAIAQCDAHERQYGQRRYSLWTGDIGTALYAAACIDGASQLPHVDPEPLARARD
jgi:hypothetical protein